MKCSFASSDFGVASINSLLSYPLLRPATPPVLPRLPAFHHAPRGIAAASAARARRLVGVGTGCLPQLIMPAIDGRWRQMTMDTSSRVLGSDAVQVVRVASDRVLPDLSRHSPTYIAAPTPFNALSHRSYGRRKRQGCPTLHPRCPPPFLLSNSLALIADPSIQLLFFFWTPSR